MSQYNTKRNIAESYSFPLSKLMPNFSICNQKGLCFLQTLHRNGVGKISRFQSLWAPLWILIRWIYTLLKMHEVVSSWNYVTESCESQTKGKNYACYPKWVNNSKKVSPTTFFAIFHFYWFWLHFLTRKKRQIFSSNIFSIMQHRDWVRKKFTFHKGVPVWCLPQISVARFAWDCIVFIFP